MPESATEYVRRIWREEHRIPESATEYAQMKQRALEDRARLKKLEEKGEAQAADRREEAKARWEFRDPKPVAKSKAILAKKDLRNALISQFSIPAGRKAELGTMIDRYAERLIRDWRLTEKDRKELFDKLYSEGVMTVPADDVYWAVRELVMDVLNSDAGPRFREYVGKGLGFAEAYTRAARERLTALGDERAARARTQIRRSFPPAAVV